MLIRAERDVGSTFGETKDPASTSLSPALTNRSIRATLRSVDSSAFSFCRPSRGPTSTTLTRSDEEIDEGGEEVERRRKGVESVGGRRSRRVEERLKRGMVGGGLKWGGGGEGAARARREAVLVSTALLPFK